ncbi:UNVERIFIED_CONTAM: hypothetical protein Slati_0254600 [Sesamum latifolium]|uniref:Uncharacterized protein n=1 Tax=Sesamum latifolium TaxID=2727402 RepID=A0AAW2YD53_9LAMI
MKERGKAVEAFNNDFSEFNFSAASEIPCKKHPSSSSVGICAYCLKDRLVKLVCSECGEQRLSSCSCSDVSSSYRNSCSTMEVGSVGRVSFLIENEKIDSQQSNNPIPSLKEEKRRRNKSYFSGGAAAAAWRSRSLCSFRGGGGHNDLDEGSEYRFSSAKISDVTSGIFLDSDKQCGFYSESEPRKSGFRGFFDADNGVDFKGGRRGGGQTLIDLDRVHSVPNRSVFPAKESDFSAMDESAFIDLKLDLSSESKQEISAARISGASDHGVSFKSESFETGGSLASMKSNGVLGMVEALAGSR